MYKIYADATTIYDSTVEEWKIGRGIVTLELNKAGSFVFSVYPDHPYYDNFVKLKTIITVTKDKKVVFRGRIFNIVTDFWNNKTITCEGELGFLQDSIIRPFADVTNTYYFFKDIIEKHNDQVEYEKRFVIEDNDDYPADHMEYNSTEYVTAFEFINENLLNKFPYYIHITHDDDILALPKINYVYDFDKRAKQRIEFGSNLKNYVKTVSGEEIATAIIPLGAKVDDGNPDTEDKRLTIAGVNGGVDYVYSQEGVDTYGWIFKTLIFEDYTNANSLKQNAQYLLQNYLRSTVTIELTAIDLHLIDHSIESINIGEYVRCVSEPHNYDETLLCSKQTIDLLNPENDTIVLGQTIKTFTESTARSLSETRKATKNVYSKGDSIKLGGAGNSSGTLGCYDANNNLVFKASSEGVYMSPFYGSNTNGKYYKFPDGTLICTKSMTFDRTFTNAWGSLYETTENMQMGNWPVAFIATPATVITSTGAKDCFLETLHGVSANSAGYVNGCRPVNTTTAQSITLTVMGIGRWM